VSTYATVQDVQDRYEGTAPDGRVQTYLNDAETMLRVQVAGLAGRAAAGDLDPELVRLVVVTAVLRHLRNPEGYVSESDGDYSYSRGPAAASTGRVTFTADELAMLRAPADRAAGWATVRAGLPVDRLGPARCREARS
jgi:hypothetical protein